jgi:hypothetical protein
MKLCFSQKRLMISKPFLIGTRFSLHPDVELQLNDEFITWGKKNLDQRHLDFADNHIFKQIFNTFRSFEIRVYNRYNSLIVERNSSPPSSRSTTNNTISDSSDSNGDYYSRLPEYSGNITVTTAAPILKDPNMKNSQTLGTIENGSATIIRRENKMYYYVKSGKIIGFLWVGWIIKQAE